MLENLDKMKVVGIDERSIYPLGDSWVVTVPVDTVRAIVEKLGEQKKYRVKVLRLSNGDLIIRISELLEQR